MEEGQTNQSGKEDEFLFVLIKDSLEVSFDLIKKKLPINTLSLNRLR
jgi:tryptophan 2,3-dioxygenase